MVMDGPSPKSVGDHALQPTSTKSGKELFFENQIAPYQQKKDAIEANNLSTEQKLWAALEEQHPQVAQALYDIKEACPHFTVQAQGYPYGATYIVAPEGFSRNSIKAVWLEVRQYDEGGVILFAEASGNNKYTRSARQEIVAYDLYTHAANMGYIRVARTTSPFGKPVCSIESGPAFRL